MSRRSAPALSAVILLLVACADDRGPTTPAAMWPDPAVLSHELTIDVATGRITVAGPAGLASMAPGGTMANSLIGDDAVEIQASNCTFSSIAGNSKQKRCRFEITLTNRLEFTDLVTPATFPRPPQGTTGILVFPYTAAALGVPGGSAVPSPDWDNVPHNFFNDFGGCGGGKASDCYRWEEFDGPLYAGSTSEPHTVGFDVDKNAQSVRVAIVVAADLRDNPLTTVTIPVDAATCGTVELVADGFDQGDMELTTAFDGEEFERGLCGFDLSAVPAGKVVTSAVFRAYQQLVAGEPYPDLGGVLVDHVDFTVGDNGGRIEVLTEDVLTERIGPLSTNANLEYKSLVVTASVRNDLDSGRPDAQFRLRFGTWVEDKAASVVFGNGVADPNPPELVVVYRDE